MSKRLLLVNVILAGVAAFFAVLLVRDLTHSRPLPRPPAPRAARTAAPVEGPTEAAGAGEKLASYNVIVTKHLFNPSRSEAGATAATPAAPPPPKPVLLGIVVDGPKSRAYLEDPSTKRVFGYQVGDTVAGGRIDQITDDKVVIVRPNGSMEVLLHDPSKPKPAAPAPAGAAQRPGQPVPRAENVPVPGQPPVPPRIIRRLPTEQPQSPPNQ